MTLCSITEWRRLLSRHGELLRDHLDAAGGRLIDTAGDGSLSIFDGPARAIRCGVDLTNEVRELGVELRVGLHTGECEPVGDDIEFISHGHHPLKGVAGEWELFSVASGSSAPLAVVARPPRFVPRIVFFSTWWREQGQKR